MDEKSIQNIPFTDETGKQHMWSVNFVARAVLKGYDILLTGNTKIPADEAEEIKYKEVTVMLELLNKTSYTQLILAQ